MKKVLSLILLVFIMSLSSAVYAIEDEPPLPPSLEKQLKMAEEKGDTKFVDQFVHMLGVLAMMIVVLWGGMWVIKKISATKVLRENDVSTIKILEKRVLSHKTTLYVIEVLGENMIIAESPNGTANLAHLALKVEK